MGSNLLRLYQYVFHDAGDPRVEDWKLVNTPYPLVVILAVYLLSIYVLLPAHMKHRRPYNIKSFIQCYNVFQICACLFIIYGIATSGWTTHYSWLCQLPDYSQNPSALRMLWFMYLYYLLKIMELVETGCFILRKNYRQVSKLHVYHHISTLTLAWIFVKYVGGGMYSFAMMLNSFIHVIMYTYYLVSALSPEWQKSAAKWKPKITACQMVQFCLILAQGLYTFLHPSCGVKNIIVFISVPNILLVFKLFYDFYTTNYVKKSKH